MNKTKIEWADYTWNPIKGLCPEACWYCYARAMYRRSRLDERVEFCVTRGEIAKMDRLPPSRIFVCSTMEMFNSSVEESWRDKIFQTIEMFPKQTFIILTKRPERIDRPMPNNVWLGVSLTGEKSEEYERITALAKAEALTKFVSFEPLFHGFDVWELFDEFTPDWIIVGRLTGHGKRRDPPHREIQDIYDYVGEEDVPLFLKNNLSAIWDGPLIQEYPK